MYFKGFYAMGKVVGALILLVMSCQANANETSIMANLNFMMMEFYLCELKLQNDIGQQEINKQHKANFDCIQDGKDNLKTFKSNHQDKLKILNLSDAYMQYHLEVMNSYSALFTLYSNKMITRNSGAELRLNIEKKYNEFMYHYSDI